MIEHSIHIYVKNNESLTAASLIFGATSIFFYIHAVSACNTILRWVNAFRTLGTLMNRKPIVGTKNGRVPGKYGTH